jgi:hypothetical protein
MGSIMISLSGGSRGWWAGLVNCTGNERYVHNLNWNWSAPRPALISFDLDRQLGRFRAIIQRPTAFDEGIGFTQMKNHTWDTEGYGLTLLAGRLPILDRQIDTFIQNLIANTTSGLTFSLRPSTSRLSNPIDRAPIPQFLSIDPVFRAEKTILA